jgi:hypothetical protein
MGNLAIKKWKNWDLAKKNGEWGTLQFDVSKPSIFLKIFCDRPNESPATFATVTGTSCNFHLGATYQTYRDLGLSENMEHDA